MSKNINSLARDSAAQQIALCLKMLRKSIADSTQYKRVWKEYVHALNGAYEMNE